jgi:hypothetical protein
MDLRLPCAIPGPSTTLPSSVSVPTPSSFDPPIPSASGFTITQTSAWNTLALQYSDQRLRRHQWEWVEKTSSFLPRYTFQPIPKTTDAWTEWTTGLNGFLSIRELDEGWGARWRSSTQTMKNQYGLRKKIHDLIDKRLASKRN